MTAVYPEIQVSLDYIWILHSLSVSVHHELLRTHNAQQLIWRTVYINHGEGIRLLEIKLYFILSECGCHSNPNRLCVQGSMSKHCSFSV